MDKTSSGIDENLAGALAYALGFLSGAAFLVVEPSNKFVRFHALQSLLLFGGLSVAWFIAVSVPPLGWILAFIVIPILSAALWLLLMYKAYQGVRFKVPFVGEIADQRAR
jgi:uncharacterized membrane protein